MATSVKEAGSGGGGDGGGDGGGEQRAGRRGRGEVGATHRGLKRRGLALRAAALAGGGGPAALLTDCGRGRADEGPPARPAASKEPVAVEYWTTWAQERVDLMEPHLP